MAAEHAALISNVLHYAAGYQMIQTLLQESLRVASANPITQQQTGVAARLKALLETPPDNPGYVDSAMQFFKVNPVLHGLKTLTESLPGSAAQVATAQSQFEYVVNHPSSSMADDAAYILGWISLQLEKRDQALAWYSQVMVIGNRDYSSSALEEVLKELRQRPPDQALTIVEQNNAFSKQPVLWYAFARSAYRHFDFRRAIAISKEGLQALNVPFEQLPVTTDLNRIKSALERIDPKLVNQINVREMPYLIEASREMLQYEANLEKAPLEPPEAFERYAKAMIIKYSLLRDPPVDPKTGKPAAARKTAHNDYRQAVHLIELSLQKIPRDPDYVELRQWLHFRYVRILTLFGPDRIPNAIAAMRQEFPTSPLLDDAMAEQIYADGIVMKDASAAEKAFANLLRQYPKGNAVDNAYDWMAIIERCAGHDQFAEDLNKEIVRRFPFTRHAAFARTRLANPQRMNDPDSCGAGQTFRSS
jgi:tetratricopeptide (TPR) repeat protein